MHSKILGDYGFIKTYDSAIPEMRHKSDSTDNYLYQHWELEKINHTYYLVIKKDMCELSFVTDCNNNCNILEGEEDRNELICKFKLRSLKFMLKRHII